MKILNRRKYWDTASAAGGSSAPVSGLNQLYVNASNPASGDGSIDNPFQTLDLARTAIIGAGTLDNPAIQNATVNVAGGNYTTANTISMRTIAWIFEYGADTTYTGTDYLFNTDTWSSGALVVGGFGIFRSSTGSIWKATNRRMVWSSLDVLQTNTASVGQPVMSLGGTFDHVINFNYANQRSERWTLLQISNSCTGTISNSYRFSAVRGGRSIDVLSGGTSYGLDFQNMFIGNFGVSQTGFVNPGTIRIAGNQSSITFTDCFINSDQTTATAGSNLRLVFLDNVVLAVAGLISFTRCNFRYYTGDYTIAYPGAVSIETNSPVTIALLNNVALQAAAGTITNKYTNEDGLKVLTF